jgi:predicted dehydrogenase
MKQVIQNYKTGEVFLDNVPVPNPKGRFVTVKNEYSLISLGTEKSIIDLGKKSIIGKAIARPDLVRRVIEKAKKEGVVKTWHDAMGRLDAPTPLGYSSSGTVYASGVKATDFSPGDRVACIGHGFASHAEFISMPENMMVRIPATVSSKEASFGMLGIIALHGVRTANLTFGSRVVVMGLGLLGLITVQILKAYGCQVFAIEPNKIKVDLAKSFGIEHASSTMDELAKMVDFHTSGLGVDAVIITASTAGDVLVNDAITLCRPKGRIVVVGVVDIHPNRNDLWHKEVEIVVSKAAGPGSLDPIYEIDGIDLPLGDVRWTQKRNLEEFLRLVKEGLVNLDPLITNIFPFSDALQAYSALLGNKLENPIGVLLEYPIEINDSGFSSGYALNNDPVHARITNKNISVGVIGAGLFARAVMLPILKKQKGINLECLTANSGANLSHLKRKFGFNDFSTDVNSVMKSQLIDVVVGMTSHSNHAALVKISAANKKPLFLEKPLCINNDELIDLINFFSTLDYAPKLMIGHNRRFSPHVAKIMEYLDKRSKPLICHLSVNAGFVDKNHWVHSQSEGGSRVVGEMSHFIDLLIWITGAKVKTVFAQRISGDNKIVLNNDNILVNLKFEDGSIASILYSASGNRSYARERLEIYSDETVIVSEDYKRTTFYMPDKVSTYKTGSQSIGYKEELDHFFNSIRLNNSFLVSNSEIFETMDIIFAIEKSLGTGEPITRLLMVP